MKYVQALSKLTGCQRDALKFIDEAWRGDLTEDEIAEFLGYYNVSYAIDAAERIGLEADCVSQLRKELEEVQSWIADQA